MAATSHRSDSRHRRGHGSLAGAASVLGLLLLPAGALAQVDDIFDLPLEDLLNARVEVASLFLEDELRVASSVSKVTEERWREQGAEKTFDALAHLPGVYVSEYFHGMQIPTFRGFANTGQYNSFLVLLDGIPLNNYSSASAAYGTPNFALGNLRDVEVIRGPGSALHGADAFNGVVSMNTWTSEEDRSEAWLEAGSFGFWQGNVRFRQSFAEGVHLTSAISAGGAHDEEIDHVFHESLPGSPLREARITGRYENLTTSHKLQVKSFEIAAYHSRNDVYDADGNGELVAALPPFGSFLIFPNGHHSDGRARMSAFRIGHTAAWKSPWTLESQAYHVEDELLGRFGLLVDNVGEPPRPPALEWDSKDQRTGARLTARRPFDKRRVQLLFALNYDHVQVNRLRVGLTGSVMPPANACRDLVGWTSQVERRFMNERLQLILGLRYDNYSDFGDHASPRLALIYHPTERSALKLLYGNAFRAPSVNEQNTNGIVEGGGDALSPELVDTLEVVWKQLGESWSFGLSTYYSEVRDSITVGPSGVGSLAYGNNLSAESYGLELEGAYQGRRWELSGNLSLNEARPTQEGGSYEDFSAYPDLMLNLSLVFRPDDALKLALNQVLHDGRQTFYLGPMATPSYLDVGPLPALWRTDLHVSWRPLASTSRLELYATVLDLFDRRDLLSAVNLVENGNGTPGRRLTVGLRTSF